MKKGEKGRKKAKDGRICKAKSTQKKNMKVGDSKSKKFNQIFRVICVDFLIPFPSYSLTLSAFLGLPGAAWKSP